MLPSTHAQLCVACRGPSVSPKEGGRDAERKMNTEGFSLCSFGVLRENTALGAFDTPTERWGFHHPLEAVRPPRPLDRM